MVKAVCSKCGFEFVGETEEILLQKQKKHDEFIKRVRRENPSLWVEGE